VQSVYERFLWSGTYRTKVGASGRAGVSGIAETGQSAARVDSGSSNGMAPRRQASHSICVCSALRCGSAVCRIDIAPAIRDDGAADDDDVDDARWGSNNVEPRITRGIARRISSMMVGGIDKRRATSNNDDACKVLLLIAMC
jgi:hypothetical protein